jgi:transposase
MQVEVLGAERRRRWSVEEKLRLVEETMQPGVTVSAIARRNDLAPSVMFLWRRLAREGRLGGGARPAFLPVQIAPSGPSNGPELSPPPASPPRCRRRTGMIEIDLGKGRQIRVDGPVDPDVLLQVLRVVDSLP